MNMKIEIVEQAGDSARIDFLKTYNLLFAKSDIEGILAMMTADAVWDMVGHSTITGQDDIRAALQAMAMEEATELRVSSIITQGNRTVCAGEMHFEGSAIAFCDIYEFAGESGDLKISKLISYGVDISPDDEAP